ncbi:MAG: ornithine carbamoyltransferase [Dehalococcoidales bacterium]|nr:ornithine carbamoyltransferase [Dehalococcoidales bacterium]MDD4230306.1 ornithine carbamoyltransferase [Dehalococcoidales bacterium]MDD4465365.1 ornithine carbamoyltransferase [Dehalococcoidales bacterium]MDD5402043.1 ornithine carbamoyltransferase [Dehalococcoidales bacterium]
MSGKHLLSVLDLTPETARALLIDALAFKNGRIRGIPRGKILALLFEKPSLRTRVSFEVAMMRLGGKAIYLSPPEVGLGKREPVADVARVLGRYVDIIAARVFSHNSLVELAETANIPVINALSDLEHPCQALADMLTIMEHKGGVKGIKIAYIGDGNNVANSLMLMSAMLGADFFIASPKGYEIQPDIAEKAFSFSIQSGANIECLNNPAEAVRGADVIYTDTWTSMGQEEEAEKRRADFNGFQINSELLCHAPERVMVMHCLPAHRGEEITGDILDGPHSVVFDQAENRAHVAGAVIAYLLGGLEISIGS